VQVIDRETEEVVREIPPESLLDFNASILRQAGLLVNEKG
jgi:flagellar protein FlaG